MLRHSPRLTANGCYDPSDRSNQRICYKETPVRIFKRRKRKGKVGGARHNLISGFDACDFQSVEAQTPPLMPEPSYQHASLCSRLFSLVRKIVFLSTLLVLLGFGIWLCYTRVASDTKVSREFSSLKQATTQHGLDYEKRFAMMELMIRRRLNKEEAEGMIRSAINLHRADDIEMTDFALESLGATVIDSPKSFKIRCCKLFGFRIWCKNNGPETVLQPDVFPGKCWLFKGNKGFLVTSLSFPVHITHVSLEHLPRALYPTGHINSAPREFTVFGLVSEKDKGKFLGKFQFDQKGKPVQTFKLPNPPKEAFRLVKLMILSNWGHPKFTCIYRFKVHGQM